MNKNKQYLSIVQGNDFELTIKVTQYDVVNQSYIDFSLDGCSQIVVFLVAVTGGRRYKLPITVNGNVLTTEIDGSMLNVGVYGLELLFEDADSKSKRSYEPALLKIVRNNAEATYTNADFDSEDDCRLHMTIGVNSAVITIGSPTADTQIDATSYNAVSNSAVADAINNLQTQIDNIGADILDPSSVYTKAETEALVDTMIDTQEMEEYVSTALSSYTTTEQFNSSVNDLNTRITAIEESPVDLSSYVSKEELSQQGYITESDVAKMGYITAGDVSSMGYITTQDVSSMGYATTQFVTEQIEAIPAIDLSSYVSKEELSQQGYITAGDITSMGYVTANDVSSMGYVTAQDVSAMGYATTQFVTEQIAAIPQPDLSTYITETELNDTLTSYAKLTDLISNERVVSTALNSLADRIETVEGDYVSATELDETLLSYATKNYVDNKIDELAPSDLNEYVSKQFLSQQGYITANDVSSMGYITAQNVSSMGYATTQYVTDQIANIPSTDLSGYVSKSELNAAGYITESDVAQMGYITANDVSAMGYITETALDTALSSYVTTTNLNTTLSSYAKVSDIEDNEQVISTALNTLSDRIGLIENDYVSDDDLENFATKNYVDEKIDELAPSDLNNYVSKQFLSQQGYVTANDVTSMGYITAQDVSAMGYATTQYVTDQIANIPATDLSSYVSKEELTAAGYITESDVSAMGYATTQYVTDQIANIPDPDLSSYVSKSELNAAAYITESDVAQMGYVTAQDVSAMGYLTANDISAMGYVTTTELSSASYVTNTALNTTLASYTTKADVPYKFVVMSYAEYTALATKDPNTFYCIPEE